MNQPLTGIIQDILSYNKEQAARDAEHNIITVIMQQFGLDAQAAFDHAGALSRRKMRRFYALYGRLPRWMGPVGLAAPRLVDGMAQCVSGVLHWSYESERYFGRRGPAIKRSRVLRLLPRVDGDGPAGSVRIDDDRL